MDEDTRVEVAQQIITGNLSDRGMSLAAQLQSTGAAFIMLLKSAFPECRETNLAITRAEEAAMWAAKSIIENL